MEAFIIFLAQILGEWVSISHFVDESDMLCTYLMGLNG